MDAKTDSELIQEAYGEALKNQFQTLFDNLIYGGDCPKERFTRGLAILRKVRDEALELVKE